MQSKICQTSVKIQSYFSQNEVKMQAKCSQNTVKIQSKFNQNSASIQPKISQKSVKMTLKFSQNSVSSWSIDWKVFSLVNLQVLISKGSEKQWTNSAPRPKCYETFTFFKTKHLIFPNLIYCAIRCKSKYKITIALSLFYQLEIWSCSCYLSPPPFWLLPMDNKLRKIAMLTLQRPAEQVLIVGRQNYPIAMLNMEISTETSII